MAWLLQRRKMLERIRLWTMTDSEQHTSGNKKAEEDAQKATDKQLEEIKQIGDKTGPKVRHPALPMIRWTCN
jgi:hypothetical protein